MSPRLHRRLAASDGYTLSEMIVVLAILGIVVAALSQLFVSALHAETGMSNRFQAQQNARLALDKLRREIHCANLATASGVAPWSSVTFALGGYCPTSTTGAGAVWSPSSAYAVGQYVRPTVALPYLFQVTAAGASGTTEPAWPTVLNATVVNDTVTFKNVGAPTVTWCTKDRNGTTPPAAGAAPYSLWRYIGASCSGTGQKWADYLTIAQVFKAYTAPAGGSLGTLSVDLPVDLTPSDTRQRYELTDDIVLRNATS
jgi:prepilin-type N-terminal cleavage/methylation domain-containing protein